MAWVTVETNQRQVVLRVNSLLYPHATHADLDAFKRAITDAVIVAERIEEPLESLKDDD